MFATIRNLCLIGLGLMVPFAASAQDESDEIVIVPFSQIDPDIPHPAFETARVTLKGIIRNAECGSYRIWWDTNFNDNFNDDPSRDVSRNDAGRTVYDIGRNFEVPGNFQADSKMNVNVRVRNLCNNNDKFATMKFFVYDFKPNNNPNNWTDEQLEIMTQVALQESLWYTHRTTGSLSGRGKTLEARDQYDHATALSLWLFTINGHLPAYPPNSIDFNVREGFINDNALRWHNDPYAETAMRLANYSAGRGALRGIPGGEEDNACGYNVDMSVRRCQRLDNPGENLGAYALGSANVYVMGVNLGGLSTVLPALNGTPLQVGNNNIRGRNWEWYIQQMVDQLGAQQIDGGCGKGGWLYGDFNGSGNCDQSDGSTTQWAYIGLESAEIAGGPYRVMVNNRHKYRIADNLINNQRGDGASGYRSSSGRGDFKLTGGALVGARWLGIHQFGNNDGATAFPGNSGYTRGRLKQAYDTYVSHLNNNWNNQRSTGSHWQDSMWQYGDYKCGNNSGVYNRGRCGSTYAMYSLQKGFRTGQPELLRVGNHVWIREFNTYYVRAQDRHADNRNPTSNYNVHGRVYDEYCEGHSVTCSYGGGRLAMPMGSLVMTPSIFNPKPVAIGAVNPPETREGCAGGNNGRVTFEHADSFHPNPESRIVLYRWDVDDGDGLWWDGDDDPDFQTQPDLNGNFEETFVYTYMRPGNYTATLQVVDEGLQTKTTTVDIRVLRAGNVAPSAAPGGPYIIEVGQDLVLNGASSDGNLACGDSVTTTWDLDGDGNFDDANGTNPTIPWNALQNLPQGEANRIFIRAVDESGAQSDVAETTLTIYPSEPVAAGSANPSPAACQQEVTFNGRASAHPNPQRTIARYEWNVDGSPGFDREGAEVRFTYGRFGTYPIILRVTDDLGRSDTAEFELSVNQGNRPPVARVAQAEYIVLEGDSVTLDGRTSSDADADCGDSIVNYRWTYTAANGQVTVLAEGANAANPTIAWDTIRNLPGPTNRDTGEPTNTVTLTVTDSFGETASANTTVNWFTARPIAVVSQTPNPAMIGQGTGRSQVSLDGRGSVSPVPGIAIETYQWIFDENNQPANDAQPDAEGATVDFVKVFQPIPGPDNIPAVSVWLKVTDDTGRSSEWTLYRPNYDVPPTKPTADADKTDPPEEGYHILECETLTVDGSQSFDPDDEDFVRFYRWDLSYDGVTFNVDVSAEDANGDGTEAVSEVSAERLVELGLMDGDGNGACTGIGNDAQREATIRLEVEDNFRQLNFDTAPLTIYKTNPVAAATANPNPAACNVQVNFDGSASFHPHPDINIQSWEWDLNGNGVYGEEGDAQGMLTTARFSEFTFGDDRKRVNLRVTDTRGNQTLTSLDVQVNIGNRAPTPNAGGGLDADGNVIGPYVIGVVPDANNPGQYLVSQVTAPGGAGLVEDSITLSSDGTSDPDVACGDRVVSTAWRVNNQDVPNADQAQLTLTWADLNAVGINAPGNYDVTLTARDRFAGTNPQNPNLGVATARQTIQVVLGPTAVGEANPARTGCENQVTLSAANSRSNGPVDQGFALALYEWDLDNDGIYGDAVGAEVSRPAVGLPDASGAITMTAGLRVTDESGRTGTTTVEVTIDSQSVPPVADAGGPYDTGKVNGGNFSPVFLDGRGSTDPNQPCDRIVYYAWDIDLDGNYGPADNEPGGFAADGNDVVEYVSAAWRVGTERTVRLIVCDANFNPNFSVTDPNNAAACSQPDETDIRISAEAPPTGDILSPRADAGTCFGTGQMTVRYRVVDPAGDRVLVTGFIGDVEVYSQRVNAPANGAEYEFNVNTDALIPEGRHEIDLILDDEKGGATVINTGGRLLFDRTEPVVTIGNELSLDSCYNPNQVPTPTVTVDDVDQGPSISREVVEDGCGRTLVVRATDSCGNTGEARRDYLVAQAVDIDLQGAENGSLVPQTQYTWEVIGRAACADDISAKLSRNGGAADNYPEGQVINQPGDYVLTVTIENCQGFKREVSRNFAINRPPIAVPIPDGHPNAVPGEDLAYVIEEGGTLQLDCSASRAPEVADRITRCEWDTDGDGVFDLEWRAQAEGEQPAPVNYNANDNGVFRMTLRVSDGANPPSTGEQVFTVTVNDVDPIPDPGGPYVIAQGVPLTLDGRASAPGSAADLITGYSWEFNDGSGACPANDPQAQNCSPVTGANATQPTHIFAEHGTYNVELTVTDEDSSATRTVRVEVRDVDPVIGGLDEPLQAYEIAYMPYTMNATPGAPGDPIVRYEWDINPAGAALDPDPEYAGAETSTIRHQYHDAGQYNLTVTVRDGDSASRVTRLVTVVEITLLQLIEHIQVRIDEEIAAAAAEGELDPVLPFADVGPFINRAIWGENNGYRGNTLLALRGIVERMAEAQRNGVRLGLETWALARQLRREVVRQRGEVLATDPAMAQDLSVQRADVFLDQIDAIYGQDGFKALAAGQNGGQLTGDILAKSIEAFFWLTDSVDQCNSDGRFPVPGGQDPVAIVASAEATNGQLVTAFGTMRDEYDNYIGAAGRADDPGPGAQQMSVARTTLADNMLPIVDKSIRFPCPPGEVCVTDLEALDMELDAMSLAEQLTTAEAEGVWVRNWRNCLTMGLRFRIEVSLLRVEFLCGQNVPYVREARDVQQVGLEMVDDGRFGAALQYYATDERRCMMIDIYNRCIVPQTTVPSDPQDPDSEQVKPDPYAVPNFCEPEEEEAVDGNNNGG